MTITISSKFQIECIHLSLSGPTFRPDTALNPLIKKQSTRNLQDKSTRVFQSSFFLCTLNDNRTEGQGKSESHECGRNDPTKMLFIGTRSKGQKCVDVQTG
ncbi:hypothetical protein MPTK1_8g09640 [Marchantia polymorpha subsp. ruderalis]|uniref:Uncharacterized protein n=1 Tax=Marchantia polymorpha TaxID=3197 RepID=A0A2R6XN28_MARPO|nr:hypothetical protein MARPO_0008s0257 [Marchantia polymorpha]BBN19318.1 hypothetical protein Mp_8g09640 [Marchantia polymorpha subsp. ruderalis]|eukprot:PTQ47515.1 hypothetical protein MARPO_0008s0257 [Marchantia polymorpha]